MFVRDKIDNLFSMITELSYVFDGYNTVSRRMTVLGVISELNDTCKRLLEIEEKVGTELSFDDAYIDKDYLNSLVLKKNQLFEEKTYNLSEMETLSINLMPDMFPLNDRDYYFSSKNADILKTGIKYLCTENNLGSREIIFAINKGINEIFSIIYSIVEKKKNIENYQYEDFWYTFFSRDDDLFSERAINDYNDWKDEHDDVDSIMLKEKRSQEILKLLKSGFFSHDTKASNREIRNSIINISEDDLEPGMIIPDNIEEECARMSRYCGYKKEILCLDYVKLGKYVYKHYADLTEEEGNAMILFDNLLLHIHEEMAEINPLLRSCLKFYDEEVKEESMVFAKDLVSSCKPFLVDGLSNDFLEKYIESAFKGDAKREVAEKLGRESSRNKYVSLMIGMLKSSGKVFRVETNTRDLAESLNNQDKSSKKRSIDTYERYIKEGSRYVRTQLREWTDSYIRDKLYSEQEQVFCKISKLS